MNCDRNGVQVARLFGEVHVSTLATTVSGRDVYVGARHTNRRRPVSTLATAFATSAEQSVEINTTHVSTLATAVSDHDAREPALRTCWRPDVSIRATATSDHDDPMKVGHQLWPRVSTRVTATSDHGNDDDDDDDAIAVCGRVG